MPPKSPYDSVFASCPPVIDWNPRLGFMDSTVRNLLLAGRSWKPGVSANTWGERGAEMMIWFGCCGDFGRVPFLVEPAYARQHAQSPLSQSIQRGLTLHLGFLSAVVVGFACLGLACGLPSLALERGCLPTVVIRLLGFR